MAKWLTIAWCLYTCQLMGQDSGFYIWQGFEHHWGYNHRLNRLGDAVVENASGEWSWVHTAASGSGADMGEFAGYATWVEGPEMRWQAGKMALELRGGEMEEITVSKVLRLDFPFSGAELPTVLLNGFDLQAAPGADADKLVELEMGVDSVWWEAEQLAFRLFCRTVLACSSPECARGDQSVDYVCEMQWLVVDASADAVAVDRSYAYRRSGPVQGPQVLDLEKKDGVHGFRRIGFALGKEDHLCDYWMGIRENAEVVMGLGQRKAGMRRSYRHYYHGFPKLPGWVAVKKKSGEVRVWAEVVSLDIAADSVETAVLRGERFWDSSYRKPRAAGDSVGVYWEGLGK